MRSNFNGKGSKRRAEDFKRVQENWEVIDWGRWTKKEIDSADRKARKMMKALGWDKPVSVCCSCPAWVEGNTTLFYVCGKCDKPCDVITDGEN